MLHTQIATRLELTPPDDPRGREKFRIGTHYLGVQLKCGFIHIATEITPDMSI